MNRPLTILMVTEDHEIQDNINQTIALLQSEWQFHHLRTLTEVVARYNSTGDKGANGLIFESPLMVILLDPHIHGDMGLAAIVYLQENLPNVPIVQILRPDEEEFGLQGIKMGAQDYILIPYLSPIKFHRTIRNALRRQDVMYRLRQKRVHRASSEG